MLITGDIINSVRKRMRETSHIDIKEAWAVAIGSLGLRLPLHPIYKRLTQTREHFAIFKEWSSICRRLSESLNRANATIIVYVQQFLVALGIALTCAIRETQFLNCGCKVTTYFWYDQIKMEFLWQKADFYTKNVSFCTFSGGNGERQLG